MNININSATTQAICTPLENNQFLANEKIVTATALPSFFTTVSHTRPQWFQSFSIYRHHYSEITVQKVCENLRKFLNEGILNQKKLQDIPNIRAISTIFSRITDRYIAIQAMIATKKFEKIDDNRSLSEMDVFKIAWYIETQFTTDITTNAIYKMKQTQLPRTLQYAAQNATVYLFAKHTLSQLKSSGSNKKTVAALTCPLADPSYCSHATRLFTRLNIMRQTLLNTSIEFQISQMFWLRNKNYFLQPYTLARYLVHQQNRISMVYERGEGDLMILLTTKDLSLTIDKKIKLATDIINSISVIHNAKYFHGDTKLENILFNIDNKNNFCAKMIDFDATSRVDEAGRLETPRSIFRSGYAGTYCNTAPELFRKTNFTGDFFKVEMFSIGTILLKLDQPEPLSWENFIYEYFIQDKNSDFLPIAPHLSMESSSKLQKFIIEKCQQLLEEITQGKTDYLLDSDQFIQSLTLHQRYLLLTRQLLHYNPKERWDCKQAKAFCDKWFSEKMT